MFLVFYSISSWFVTYTYALSHTHKHTHTLTLNRELEALQMEKRNLHAYLKVYERDFSRLHGRPVTKHADIQPVAHEYQRYKVGVCLSISIAIAIFYEIFKIYLVL